MSQWINMPTKKEIEDNIGFVYVIKNRLNNRCYIGKKLFWFKTRKRINCVGNKKKKKTVKGLKESDWKDYTGSSPKLNADINYWGIVCFDKTILSLHKDKFSLSYEELRQQVVHNVLFDNNYYNEIINVRLRKRK